MLSYRPCPRKRFYEAQLSLQKNQWLELPEVPVLCDHIYLIYLFCCGDSGRVSFRRVPSIHASVTLPAEYLTT